MRRAPASAVALILVALLQPAALAQPAAPPALGEGDRWEWELDGSERREMVASVETVRFHGEDVEAVRIERAMSLDESGSAAGGGEALAVTVWLRASDLAYLRSESRPLEGGATREHVAAEPCTPYQWPLTVGAAWEDDCGAAFAWPWGDFEPTPTVWRGVVALDAINVSAGWFEAYVIETREQGPAGALLARVWVSRETCGDVRRERWVDGVQHAQELASYRCGADATPPTPEPEGAPPTMPPPTARFPPPPLPLPSSPSLPPDCTSIAGAPCTSMPAGAPVLAAICLAAFALAAARKRS